MGGRLFSRLGVRLDAPTGDQSCDQRLGEIHQRGVGFRLMILRQNVRADVWCGRLSSMRDERACLRSCRRRQPGGRDGRVCWLRPWRTSPETGRGGLSGLGLCRIVWGGMLGGLRLRDARSAARLCAGGCWAWGGPWAADPRRLDCGGGGLLIWACAECHLRPCAVRPVRQVRVHAGCPAPDRGPAGRSRRGGFFRQSGRLPRTFCAVRGCGLR
jgi:hypothetical protein